MTARAQGGDPGVHLGVPLDATPGGSREDPALDDLALQVRELAGEPLPAILAWVSRVGATLPDPGARSTLARWSAMATVGAVDLEVARALEPHVDALSILREAGLGARVTPGSTWGVYAAEGPGLRLDAVRLTADGDGTQWRLSGRKPWCSLAGSVSHALVTAWVDDERRGLFSYDLTDRGVHVEDERWAARGLSRIESGPVRFDDVAAEAVGGPGWYLERDGFAWGGMGVASVWFGGAVGVFRRMLAHSATRPPDQIAAYHLGMLDARLIAVRALFVEVAGLVDAGRAGGSAGALAAARLRLATAECVDEALMRAAHAMGPAPLTREADHAQRVADLQVYVRQHHAERDAAALGRQVLEDPSW